MKYTQAIDFMLMNNDKTKNSGSLVAKQFDLSLWRPSGISSLLKYLSLKNFTPGIVSSVALKALDYAEAKTVIFYLPQLFQSLRVDSQNMIALFLINASKQSASVAHNVLWFCRVESVVETGGGRKVPLVVKENLNEKASQLMKVLLEESHMSRIQSQFFTTETEFFEKITSISGMLQPSQSKDEKKTIIREKLIEYN